MGRPRIRGGGFGWAAGRRAWPLLAAAACVTLFASASVETTEGLVAPLDDAYIHLQYARSIADGHPFAYHPSEPPSSGASSIAWAGLLSLPHLVGLEGSAALGVALLFGGLCLAGVLGLAGPVMARLFGRRAAGWGRVAIVAWGWTGWFAASGMEVALASLAVIAAWRTLLALDGPHSPGLERGGALLALLLPFVRAELAPFALALAFAIGARRPSPRRLSWAALAASGVALVPLFWFLLTGRTRTNGQIFKWVFALPYFDQERLEHWLGLNLKKLGAFLDGRADEGMLPRGVFAFALALGGAIVVGRLLRKRGLGLRRARGVWLALGATLAVVAATLTSTHFDAHRYRYLAPLMPVLLLLAAGGAWSLSRLAMRWGEPPSEVAVRLGHLGAAVFVGALLWGVPDARTHYGRAASEIAAQHVRMAARLRALPEDAVVAINDAGVLAYLGGRRTFDVVGLTTNHATPYYVAGPASEHEMFEALPRAERPTHFVLYARWWRARHLLGRQLAVEQVSGPTAIVGGTDMALYEADAGAMDELDLGDAPRAVFAEVAAWTRRDSVDVADVRDEAAHGYFARDWRWVDQVVVQDGRVRDGGRFAHREDGFDFDADAGRAARIVWRAHALERGAVEVRVNGRRVGRAELEAGPGFQEFVFDVPAESVRETNRLEARRADGPVASLHWWVYQRGGDADR